MIIYSTFITFEFNTYGFLIYLQSKGSYLLWDKHLVKVIFLSELQKTTVSFITCLSSWNKEKERI